MRYHLTPLSRLEMERYIQHRLQVVGVNGRPAFTSWALWFIYRIVRGWMALRDGRPMYS